MSIVCGSSVCPICKQATTALIGPCDDCDEYFALHGKWPRAKRLRESGSESDT